ncbi:hypothetical protein KQH40_00105 [bacterium]|nr:hypothetical protein [bacterium]
MYHIVLGIVITVGFFILRDYARKQQLEIGWWKWSLTALVFAFGAVVLEVIYGFLAERATQAAFLIGVFGILLTVVFGVLLGRFAFVRKASS